MADKLELASEAVEPQVEPTSRLKSFTLNHPRTAKAVGVVALTAAVLGAVQIVKNRRQIVDSIEGDTSEEPFDTSSETA